MYWGYPPEWIAQWIEDLIVIEKKLIKQQFFKICDANGIAGFSALQENDNNIEINHLWIRPEAMGQGYGKKLLNFMIEMVAHQEKHLIVVSEPHAEGFYRKFGFTVIDQLESKPGADFFP